MFKYGDMVIISNGKIGKIERVMGTSMGLRFWVCYSEGYAWYKTKDLKPLTKLHEALK